MIARVLRDARVAYPLLALWFLGTLVLGDAPIGYRHDWNIPFVRDAMRQMWTGTDGFTYWNQDQFGGPPFYPTIAPFFAMLSLLATLSLPPWFVERLVIFVTLVLAGLGADLLARRLGASRLSARLGGAAFMSSAFLFTEIAKGVLQDPLSYALMPWAAFAFLGARRDGEGGFAIDRAAIAAGLVWAVGSFQVQYVVINAIDLAVFAFATRRIVPFVVAGAVFALADSYYLIPYLASLSTISAALSAMSPVGQIYALSPAAGAALRLTGCDCRFPEQGLGARGLLALWPLGGYCYFAAALAAGIFARAWIARVFAAVLAGGVVLTAGTSLLGPLYPFLVQHVPSAYAFRESYKFAAVPALFGALAIGYLPEALARIPRFPRAALLAPALAIALVIWNGLPFFSSSLSTQLNQVALPASAEEAYRREAATAPNVRVGFVPDLVPVQPDGSSFTGIDPYVSWAPRPSFGNYVPSPFSKLLSSALYHGRVDEFAALSRLTGVRYYDVRAWLTPFFGEASGANASDLDRNVFTTESGVRTLHAAGATAIATWPKETLYDLGPVEASAYVPRPRLAFVAGGFEAIPALNGGNRLTAFASQTQDAALARTLIARADEIVMVDGQNFDLEASLLPRGDQVEPGTSAVAINANADWGNGADWNSWWWFDHDMIETSDRFALAGSQNHAPLALHFGGYAAGPVHVLVKMFTSDRAGVVDVSFAGKTHALVTNSSRDATYAWFDCGAAMPDRGALDVTLRSVQGENAVARVVAVPQPLLRQAISEAIGFERSRPVASLFTREVAEGSVITGKGGSYRVSLLAPRGFARAGSTSVRARTVTAELRWKRGDREASATLRLPAGQPEVRYSLHDPNAYALLIEPASLDRAAGPAYETGPISTGERVVVSAGGAYRLTTNYNAAWTSDDPRAVHFVADGYANGWLFDRDEIARVDLGTAHLGRLGRIVSIVTLLACLGYFGLRGRPRTLLSVAAVARRAKRSPSMPPR